MMRTFIAVDVASSATIGRLQSDIMSAQGWSARDVKPIEAHNFHFTLIFLGEIRDGDADSIKAKLSEVQFEPFTITYVDVGANHPARNRCRGIRPRTRLHPPGRADVRAPRTPPESYGSASTLQAGKSCLHLQAMWCQRWPGLDFKPTSRSRHTSRFSVPRAGLSEWPTSPQNTEARPLASTRWTGCT